VCIVLVEPFVSLHDVENPLLEVVKHADLQFMVEVGLQEVGHDTGNMSNHVEFSVKRRNESLALAAFVLASLSVRYRL